MKKIYRIKFKKNIFTLLDCADWLHLNKLRFKYVSHNDDEHIFIVGHKMFDRELKEKKLDNVTIEYYGWSNEV